MIVSDITDNPPTREDRERIDRDTDTKEGS